MTCARIFLKKIQVRNKMEIIIFFRPKIDMYFIHEETHYNRSQRTLAKQKRDIPNTTRQRVVKEKQNLKGNEFKHKPSHRVCNFLKPYVFIIEDFAVPGFTNLPKQGSSHIQHPLPVRPSLNIFNVLDPPICRTSDILVVARRTKPLTSPSFD